MTELNQALAEINAIRAQVARGTQFRGYGPASIAASGLLALFVAWCDAAVLHDDGRNAALFLGVWITTAAVTAALTAFEAVVRARRVHHGFSHRMILTALEQFLPATLVGALLTAVLLSAAPTDLWMLPGLWQLIFSLGVFASCRFLPRPMLTVGVWYLGCGLGCLILSSGARLLSPWEMGIPFGLGQLLVAAVLRYGSEGCIEES